MTDAPPETTHYLDAATYIRERVGRAITPDEYVALAERYGGDWWPTSHLWAIAYALRQGRPPVPPVLSHAVAAIRIVQLIDRPLTVGENHRLRAWFPHGVPEDLVKPTAEKIRRPRPELRVVK